MRLSNFTGLNLHFNLSGKIIQINVQYNDGAKASGATTGCRDAPTATPCSGTCSSGPSSGPGAAA